jgi:23S rRNA pseudouridine955/2504/2580 synthase
VADEFDGQRLDNFLLREVKGVPKTLVYRIIRSGEVRVDGARAAADTRLATGQRVRVPPLRLPAKAMTQPGPANASGNPQGDVDTAPPRQFATLHEDEHLLVIDKPAGVAVHGGSGVSFGVIEQLRRARPDLSYLELAHRLDKETSGVLVLAKKRSALARLQAQFRARQAHKVYLAVVPGRWPGQRKVIDVPLHKYVDAQGERRVRSVSVGATHDDGTAMGKRAITLVRVLHSLPLTDGPDGLAGSLLEVTIKTGRTHQIRVHLADEGHAILGDAKYGDFALNKRLAKEGHGRWARMCLHAWRLALNHPATGERLDLVSRPPAEWMAS